jgi:hyperosmotically inducible periplasmic protein
MKASLILTAVLASWLPAVSAQGPTLYARVDPREAINRVERHGDEFKSEFKRAIWSARLQAKEERLKEAAQDLEDEVDNLRKNYKDQRYREAKENLEVAMLIAPINRFLMRHYFGPEARRAWENLRTDLNVIAIAYGVPPLSNLVVVTHSNTSAGSVAAPRSADRMNTVSSPRRRAWLERMVRHELVMLPHYGVFDNLAFRVDSETVTLMGQVTRPTLKASAENVVHNIEGVERVLNQIEVLPLSTNDDRIRIATYRAIYGHSALNRYALQAVPPVHIIVRNGHVTLEGVVANESDRNIVNIQARSVPGVFSVTNNLRIE